MAIAPVSTGQSSLRHPPAIVLWLSHAIKIRLALESYHEIYVAHGGQPLTLAQSNPLHL